MRVREPPLSLAADGTNSATISLLGDVGPQGRSEFVLTNKLVIPFDPFVVANAQGGKTSRSAQRRSNKASKVMD